MYLGRAQRFLQGSGNECQVLGWVSERQPSACLLNGRVVTIHVKAKPPLQVCVLDAGCGEGMYLGRVQAALRGSGKGCKAYGVDVSKIAIRMAAKRHKQASFAVASSYVLPFDDQARQRFAAVGCMHLFGSLSHIIITSQGCHSTTPMPWRGTKGP